MEYADTFINITPALAACSCATSAPKLSSVGFGRVHELMSCQNITSAAGRQKVSFLLLHDSDGGRCAWPC